MEGEMCELNEECVQLGKYVIVQRQNYMKLFKLTQKGVIHLGKDEVDMSSIVGQPFWKTYKMEPQGKKKRAFYLVPCDRAVSFSDQLIKEVTSGVDNRELIDDGSSQKLSTEEIISLRDSGKSAEEIVGQLIENSTTFHSKTEYSQEKYLKKKEKKYFSYIMIRKPTIRLVAEIVLKQSGPTQMNGLRIDTLAQITSIANVQSGGTYLLYENTGQGLVAAQLLSNIGLNGTLIYSQPNLSAQKQAITSMNFSDEQLQNLLIVNVTTLIKKLNMEEDETLLSNDSNNQSSENLKLGKRRLEASEANPEVKKLKWEIETEKAVEILTTKKLDGLVIVSREHPSNIFNYFVKHLSISKPFVIHFPVREPLQDLYCELKARHDIIALRLTESWLRYYQVLPNRTHPDVNVSGTGGYLLSGLKVAE